MPSAKEKLLKYNQYHIDPSTTTLLRQANSVTTPVEFDGAAEFWVEVIEDLFAVFSDPTYIEVVMPDEKTFIDRDNAILLIGHEEVKWERTITA